MTHQSSYDRPLFGLSMIVVLTETLYNHRPTGIALLSSNACDHHNPLRSSFDQAYGQNTCNDATVGPLQAVYDQSFKIMAIT